MKKYLTSLSFCLFLFLIFNADAYPEASFGLQVDCPQAVEIGQPFYLKVVSSVPLDTLKLRWLERELPLDLTPAPDGGSEALVVLAPGLSRAPGAVKISLAASVGKQTEMVTREIQVLNKEYPTQSLAVDKKFVDLSPKVKKRVDEERKIVGKVLRTMSPRRLWDCPFAQPVQGRISSTFGLKRIFNGKPSNPHTGLDIAASTGTPVLAMDDGIVLLAANHYFSGNAVFLDHGQGLISMYMHLSKISVQEGQKVRAGEVVGLVGSTGRVTGPHLHFGINILGERTDPMGLLKLSCP